MRRVFSVLIAVATIGLGTIPATAAPLLPGSVTVCAWPSWCGSLWGIAHHYRIQVADLKRWNPGLEHGHHWRLVHRGERVQLHPPPPPAAGGGAACPNPADCPIPNQSPIIYQPG